MRKKVIQIFYKYFVYYPVVLLRLEWMWKPRRELEKSQYFSLEELTRIQLARVNQLLISAKTSKFYRSRDLPASLETLEQMSKLPFLEKEELREHFEELLTNKKPLRFTTKISGGSTGAPVTLKKPAMAMANELAATWRGYSWAGIDIGDMQARFWGVPMTAEMKKRAALIDLIARRERFSAFRFDAADLDDYIQRLIEKQPSYFYGYASMIYELAVHVIERNMIGKITPKAIVTTSEVLSETMREIIEKAFECKIFNEYGCGEVGTIAHECEHGKMHITMENIFVEIVDENGTSLPYGSAGEIVVTDLNNDYMPLIRYRLRDFGSISSEPCKCGRSLLVLSDIKGRAYDFITNEAGQKFHGEFFLYIIEELKFKGILIKAIQFVRRQEELEIFISANDDDFKNSREYIKDKLVLEFSSTVPLKFTATEKIEREASGKLRVIKSEV